MADKLIGTHEKTGEPIFLDEKTGKKYTLLPRDKPKKEEKVVDEKVVDKNANEDKFIGIITDKNLDNNIKEDEHKMADDLDRLEEKLDRRLNEKMNAFGETIVNRLRGEFVGEKKQEEQEKILKTAVEYSKANQDRLDKLETSLEKINDLKPGELKAACVGIGCHIEEQKKKEEEQKRYFEEQRKISEGLNDRFSKLQDSMLTPCPNQKCGKLISPLTGRCPFCGEDIEDWTADDGTVWVKKG